MPGSFGGAIPLSTPLSISAHLVLGLAELLLCVLECPRRKRRDLSAEAPRETPSSAPSWGRPLRQEGYSHLMWPRQHPALKASLRDILSKVLSEALECVHCDNMSSNRAATSGCDDAR